MRKTFVLAVAASATAALLVGEAQGGLFLTIDILTPNEFKFTLGGTFDADVVGDQRQWLAVKNDWTNNFGVNTDWLDDSLGNVLIDDAPWTVVENSVLIDGLVPTQSIVAASVQTWGDSIYFSHSDGDILAGMTVSGSVHVQGVGLFDDSITNLELLSGFANAIEDWVRLEGGPGGCPWDLDDNDSVGATDLLSLLVNWGPYEPCPPYLPMDFDQNCTVSATDLLAMLVNWGDCPCKKDRKIDIPTCDSPPIQQFGNTTGAGNDSALRDSEDLIFGINIGEAGTYSFDMTTNVDDPCEWDSYMYLIDSTGDPCEGTGVIAFNDHCPGIGCIGLSCINDVSLEPGEYWIVIEGFSEADSGPVDLHITSSCPPQEFEAIECPFPPAADGDPLCENPELNCLYVIVDTAGPCPPQFCVPGAFLCVSPCPPPVQGACPGLATFLLPGGCTITATSLGANCQSCPQGARRILVIDPTW